MKIIFISEHSNNPIEYEAKEVTMKKLMDGWALELPDVTIFPSPLDTITIKEAER